MKKLIIFILFVLFSLNKDLYSENFIHGLEDIPIYKNMKYLEDSLVLFDKIEGRYVSSEIYGFYKKTEVIEFYDQILPNLGWVKIKFNVFERGNETLEIKISEESNKTSAVFKIYPGK